MASTQILRKLFLAVLSALLAGVVCLLLAYFAGVVIVALSLRELPATLLAAVTVLPLMLIFIGIPVTIVLAVMTGALLGIGAGLRTRPFGIFIGAVVGLLCAIFVLSLVLPLIVPPKDDDFIHIISRPYLAGSYGLLLGMIASALFRWIDGKKK